MEQREQCELAQTLPSRDRGRRSQTWRGWMSLGSFSAPENEQQGQNEQQGLLGAFPKLRIFFEDRSLLRRQRRLTPRG